MDVFDDLGISKESAELLRDIKRTVTDYFTEIIKLKDERIELLEKENKRLKRAVRNLRQSQL